MRSQQAQRRYKYGDGVERGDGYVYVKTRDNGWMAEHRHKMSLRMELGPQHRVMHLDNTLRGIDPEAFNDEKNLAVVIVRTTRWVKLKRTRVVFGPSLSPSPHQKAPHHIHAK